MNNALEETEEILKIQPTIEQDYLSVETDDTQSEDQKGPSLVKTIQKNNKK